MKIKDSVVFVTGASRGLGLAFAREALARDAAKVDAGAVSLLAQEHFTHQISHSHHRLSLGPDPVGAKLRFQRHSIAQTDAGLLARVERFF